MMPTRYATFHSLIQTLAASRPGSWFLSRVLRPMDRLLLKLTRGRLSLTALLAGLPVVMVTTTGARTGLPRTLPLLPIWEPSQPGTFALIASNWGQHHFPAWYFNLKKNPLAVCSLDGHVSRYRSHEAAGEEYERFWAYATATYFGYALYRQRAGRRVPVLVLTPLES